MKKSLITVACTLLALFSFGQSSSEYGLSMGFSGYLGDLQSPNYTYQDPGFLTGFFARYNLTSGLSGKAFLNFTRIHASDMNSSDQGHIDRNLSFRSNIMEFGCIGEFNVLPFDPFHPENKRYRRYFQCTPFFTFGLNVFHFNPQTYYNGQWLRLNPLRTEGQNYNLTQLAIPFGMGIKYQPTPRIVCSFELGFRKTFTDYLDDVSTRYIDPSILAAQNGALSAELSYRGDEKYNSTSLPEVNSPRGNPDNKDWYLINTFSVSYKFYHVK